MCVERFFSRITVVALLVGLAGVLGACGRKIEEIPAKEIANTTVLKDTEFDADFIFNAPVITQSGFNGVTTDYTKYYLRGRRSKKTDKITHALHITVRYAGERRYYQTASFEGGEERKLKVIFRRKHQCISNDLLGKICQYSETLVLPIDHDLVAQKLNFGIRIRLNARTEYEEVLSIPPNYIQGYMMRLSAGSKDLVTVQDSEY